MHFFVVCLVFEVNKSEMVNHIYRASVSDYLISISIQSEAADVQEIPIFVQANNS